MTSSRTIKIERVHPIEYTMPLKRPYGTARGVTKASTSFLIRLHGTGAEGMLTAVGEAQPRRKLTGDISTDVAWEFFKTAARSLVGKELRFGTKEEALDTVRATMADLRLIAQGHSEPSNAAKPFRGCLLGFEVALLDLVAQSLDLSIADLLGKRREDVEITVRTLSTQNTLERFRDRVAKQANIFPMVRVKGKGDVMEDTELLRLIHDTNVANGVTKPVWMDLNEGYDPESAKLFIEEIVRDIEADRLPETITLEQPISHTVGEQLPALQRHADMLTTDAGVGEIRIMPDESIWDIDDLEQLHSNGGCRAMNIKTAKAGGILASLDLAQRAVELNPDSFICIGGMVGTSDITTWSLLHLGQALPRLDYITAVPPSNVAERFSAPLAKLKEKTSILETSESPGLGAKLAYERLIPYIKRHAWYPAIESSDDGYNSYEVAHLQDFTKKQVDSYVLEKESLAIGLSTRRTSSIDFTASDRAGREISFSWTMSTASSRVATGITSDKHSTRLLLERAGVPVPKGRRFGAGDYEIAAAFASEIGYPVVLKPLRGTGGAGVVTDIRNSEELRWAFDALAGTKYEHQDVVVEEQLDGTGARIFVLKDRVLSVCLYKNGTVIGDGRLSIGELLLKKHRLRRRNPHLMNRDVRLDDGTAYQLKRQGLDYDSVIEAGHSVVFTVNPNFQQGGETEEVLKEVHPSFIEASISAVNAIPGLAFSGVDFIMSDHRLPLEDQKAGICELNAHPAQTSHEFPLRGEPGPVSRGIVVYTAAGPNLELLDTPLQTVSVRMLIDGVVRGDEYSNWFADIARGLGVSGWIRRWDTHTHEALLQGKPAYVASLSSRAFGGPGRHKIDTVETIPAYGISDRAGFQVHG